MYTPLDPLAIARCEDGCLALQVRSPGSRVAYALAFPWGSTVARERSYPIQLREQRPYGASPFRRDFSTYFDLTIGVCPRPCQPEKGLRPGGRCAWAAFVLTCWPGLVHPQAAAAADSGLCWRTPTPRAWERGRLARSGSGRDGRAPRYVRLLQCTIAHYPATRVACPSVRHPRARQAQELAWWRSITHATHTP